MASFYMRFGSIILGILGAAAIIGTALFTKGTEWNDTGWLIAFCAWLFIQSVFEAYKARRKNVSK